MCRRSCSHYKDFCSSASTFEMSRQLLPVIGSSGSKTAGHQRPHQAKRQKRSRQQTSSSSSSHPHPAPPSILLPDTTMAPWGGLPLSDTSFTSISPRPAPAAPPLPPAPQPPPSTPFHGRLNKDQEDSSSSMNSEVPSPPSTGLQDITGGRGLPVSQRVLPQNRVPRPPRLPPLRQVTNLSFSRSFTFSFFELPLHQSPHCRAERIRNLMLLLRQIHY